MSFKLILASALLLSSSRLAIHVAAYGGSLFPMGGSLLRLTNRQTTDCPNYADCTCESWGMSCDVTDWSWYQCSDFPGACNNTTSTSTSSTGASHPSSTSTSSHHTPASTLSRKKSSTSTSSHKTSSTSTPAKTRAPSSTTKSKAQPSPSSFPKPPQAKDTCGDWYDVLFDHFEIYGKNFNPSKLGHDGSGLESQIQGCGDLTAWSFGKTTTNGFQWYASGNLPIGTKSCVGNALVTAGGSSASGCTGAGK